MNKTDDTDLVYAKEGHLVFKPSRSEPIAERRERHNANESIKFEPRRDDLARSQQDEAQTEKGRPPREG